MGATATRTRHRNAMPLVAFGLALAASVALLLAPTGERQESCGATGSTVGSAPTGQPACVDRVTHVNLLQQEGVGVVSVLAVPVLVAGAALALQGTRWSRTAALVAGTLLVAFSLVGIASIGIFYLPSGVAMFMASSHPARRPEPA